MLVGIVIAFFQALTQIQEMTLTFIPKMVTVFGMLIATGPFIGEQMVIFSQQAFSRMESGFDRGRSSPAGRDASPSFELRPGFPDLPRRAFHDRRSGSRIGWLASAYYVALQPPQT